MNSIEKCRIYEKKPASEEAGRMERKMLSRTEPPPQTNRQFDNFVEDDDGKSDAGNPSPLNRRKRNGFENGTAELGNNHLENKCEDKHSEQQFVAEKSVCENRFPGQVAAVECIEQLENHKERKQNG